MTKPDTNISAVFKSQQDDKQMYDKQAKKWLADKQVLARILKYIVVQGVAPIEGVLKANPNVTDGEFREYAKAQGVVLP